jgi:hypothetical protein
MLAKLLPNVPDNSRRVGRGEGGEGGVHIHRSGADSKEILSKLDISEGHIHR